MLLRLKVYVNTFTDNTVREATPCCKSHELLLYLIVVSPLHRLPLLAELRGKNLHPFLCVYLCKDLRRNRFLNPFQP